MTYKQALSILANSQHFPKARDLILQAWRVVQGREQIMKETT